MNLEKVLAKKTAQLDSVENRIIAAGKSSQQLGMLQTFHAQCMSDLFDESDNHSNRSGASAKELSNSQSLIAEKPSRIFGSKEKIEEEEAERGIKDEEVED